MSARKLAPGPKGRPVIGNMLGYSRDPLGFLTRCSREYGDVVRLRFPGTLAYLITQPDHVEQVLVKNNRNFIKDKYTREELSVLGNGLQPPARTRTPSLAGVPSVNLPRRIGGEL